jgi:hypothetical protein
VRVNTSALTTGIVTATAQLKGCPCAQSGRLEWKHASWLRHLDTWQALSMTQRAATIEGSEATLLWFERCLDELALAGIGPAAFVTS